MANRFAGVLGLIAFAMTLLAGAWSAGNSFSTTVLRALGALVVTLLVGWIVGHMAEAMLNEHVRSVQEKIEEPKVDAVMDDR